MNTTATTASKTYDALLEALTPKGFYETALGGGLMGIIFEGEDATVLVTEDGVDILIGFYDRASWDDGGEEDDMVFIPTTGTATVEHIAALIVERQSKAGAARA